MTRPRPGKPAPWSISGLMLPDLALMLNMDGQSVAGLAKKTPMESLLKRLEALQRIPSVEAGGWEHGPAVHKRMENILRLLKGRRLFEAIPDIEQDQRAALAGDVHARERVNALGEWALIVRLCPEDNWMHASATHCAETEWASQVALERLRESNFSGLADEVQRNPTLQNYFSPKAVRALRMAQSVEQTVIVRASALCEFLLSQVARLSFASIEFLNDPSLLDAFQYLLAPDKKGRVRPGRAFLDWLRCEAGAPSMAGLLGIAAKHLDRMDTRLPSESTLKRWSCGQVFPSERVLMALVKPLAGSWGDKDASSPRSKRVGAVYCVARRLDALLRLAQCLFIQPGWPHNQPALLMLMETTTTDEWISSGYKKWLTHWRESTTWQVRQTT